MSGIYFISSILTFLIVLVKCEAVLENFYTSFSAQFSHMALLFTIAFLETEPPNGIYYSKTFRRSLINTLYQVMWLIPTEPAQE